MTREVNGVAVQVETYEYNALGALKVNASVAVDAKRPRLDGAGVADLAIAATLGAQPVVLDNGGSVTSLRGTQFTWTRAGDLRSITPPSPGTPITYRTDGQQRRLGRSGPSTTLYVNEGPHRVAVVNINAATLERYLFDGIDHPLRTKGTTTAYYEVDLAGNVRRLRAPGGVDLGGYRYTAFGQTLEDTATVAQPLRWKGRPLEVVAGVEIYDMRARQWVPELGAFLTIDEYAFQDATSTLWGWPGQNPLKWSDPSGRDGTTSNPVQDLLDGGWLPPGLAIFGHGVRERNTGIGMMANDATFEAGMQKMNCGNATITGAMGVIAADRRSSRASLTRRLVPRTSSAAADRTARCALQTREAKSTTCPRGDPLTSGTRTPSPTIKRQAFSWTSSITWQLAAGHHKEQRGEPRRLRCFRKGVSWMHLRGTSLTFKVSFRASTTHRSRTCLRISGAGSGDGP